MLTDDKTITTPEYWNSLYTGKRNNAPVDSSNGVRASTFDRFTIVSEIVEGPRVLEVAAGHARISSQVKKSNPEWEVIAADQSTAAKAVSGFQPYLIFPVYEIPFTDKYFQTLICTQAFEYFEHLDWALREFKRVAVRGVFTFPRNEMGSWSQLYIFTPESVEALVSRYSEMETMLIFDHLILVKTKFL